MAHFTHASVIPHPRDEVFAWHERPGTFERLAPPGSRLVPVERSDGIADGSENIFDVGVGPLRWRWTARHDGYVRGRSFRDVEVSGPLPSWSHVHRFEDAQGGCRLVDEIDYTAPLGPVGAALTGVANRRLLKPMFTFRHARTRLDLDRHLREDPVVRRVGITGSSGFLGSALTAYLSSGNHDVVPLPRRPEPEDLDGLDAVVHLAAEPIFGVWTPAKRERIRSSRVDGTRHLVEVMRKMADPPGVLLSVTGIAVHGGGFMARLAHDWENAALEAAAAGIRVVTMRLAPVIGSGGGMLGPSLPAFRLGLGAVIGVSDAAVSWIGLDDVVGAVEHLLRSEAEGPIDLVAPDVVTQGDFARTVGRVLSRPVFLHIPESIVNGLAGDLGRGITESLAVVPVDLAASGFEWITPTLEDALRWELLGIPPG